jgi:hypothetical protein
MTSDPGPSAGVLLDVVLEERQIRLDSVTAMDQRAAIVLGFTGSLVALTVLLPRWWLQLAVYLVAADTTFRCLRVLRVEFVPGLSAMTIRNDYLMADAGWTRRCLLDLLVAGQGPLSNTLRDKSDKTAAVLASVVRTIGVMAVAGLIGGML